MKCPCCKSDIEPDGPLQVYTPLNLIMRNGHLRQVPARVAALAYLLLHRHKYEPPELAAELLGDPNRVDLLFVYITQLRKALKGLATLVTYSDGRYRLVYINEPK